MLAALSILVICQEWFITHPDGGKIELCPVSAWRSGNRKHHPFHGRVHVFHAVRRAMIVASSSNSEVG
jgi:hypothetical protein